MRNFVFFIFLLWEGTFSLLRDTTTIPTVFILITVKTNHLILKECLESLQRHRPPKAILKQQIILIDDGSPKQTIAYEKELCSSSKIHDIHCLETDQSQRGYTHAVNKGIQYSLTIGNSTNNDAILLLNSDVKVTFGWLQKLYRQLYSSDSRVMSVGPVSNAASYQSIPECRTPDGKSFATNPLPFGLDVDYLGYVVSTMTIEGKEEFPLVAEPPPIPLMVLNGFCYLLKMSIFSKIGYFDTNNFPTGYGEEVDYSIRISRAGYRSMYVPSVYVYHQKTASFTISSREKFLKKSSKILRKMYSEELKAFDRIATKRRKHMNFLSKNIRQLYQDYHHFKHSESFLNRVTPQLTSTTALASLSFSIPKTMNKRPTIPEAVRVLYMMGLTREDYDSHSKWKSSLLRILVRMKENGHDISILDHPVIFQNASVDGAVLGQYHPNGVPQIHQTSINPETLNSMLLNLHSDLFRFREGVTLSPSTSLTSSINRLLSFHVIASDSCPVIALAQELISSLRRSPSFRNFPSPLLLLYRSKGLSPGTSSSSFPFTDCSESFIQKMKSASDLPYIAMDSKWWTLESRRYLQQFLPQKDHQQLDSHLLQVPPPVDHFKFYWDQSHMLIRHGAVPSPLRSLLTAGLESSSFSSDSPRRTEPYRALINLGHLGNLNNIEFIVDIVLLLLSTSERMISMTIIGSKSLLHDGYHAMISSRVALNPEYTSPSYYNISQLERNKYVEFIEPATRSRYNLQITSSNRNPRAQQHVEIPPELLRRHDFLLDFSRSWPSGQDIYETIATGCIPIIPSSSYSNVICDDNGLLICLGFNTTDPLEYQRSLLSLIGVKYFPPQQYSEKIFLSPSLIPELVLNGYRSSIRLSTELSTASLSNTLQGLIDS